MAHNDVYLPTEIHKVNDQKAPEGLNKVYIHIDVILKVTVYNFILPISSNVLRINLSIVQTLVNCPLIRLCS